MAAGVGNVRITCDQNDGRSNIQTNVRLFQTNAYLLSTNIPLRQMNVSPFQTNDLLRQMNVSLLATNIPL